MSKKRTSSARPSLKNVFASRSVAMAKQNRALKMWSEIHNTRHFQWLLKPENYPKNMGRKTAENLHRFVYKWLNRRAALEVKFDGQVKETGGKTEKASAYNNAVKEREANIAKRFSEKVALDQLGWVLARQKNFMARGKKIDQLEAGPKVNALAQELRRSKDKAAGFVRLAEIVLEIPLIGTKKAIAEAYYGRPTAEETLTLNRILCGVIGGYPAWGCSMRCNVLNAVLTKAGWKNYHVRTIDIKNRPHSVVMANIPKTKIWLVADPYFDGRFFLHDIERFRKSKVVSQIGLDLGREITRLERIKKWKKGRCLASNVKNFNDYAGGN